MIIDDMKNKNICQKNNLFWVHSFIYRFLGFFFILFCIYVI